MGANFSVWYESVTLSRNNESYCGGQPTPPSPAPTPPGPAPPSHGCDWRLDTGLNGADMKVQTVASKEECCDLCKSTSGCMAADFNAVYVRTGVPNPDGVFEDTMDEDLHYAEKVHKCHLKDALSPKVRHDGSIACVPRESFTV